MFAKGFEALSKRTADHQQEGRHGYLVGDGYVEMNASLPRRDDLQRAIWLEMVTLRKTGIHLNFAAKLVVVYDGIVKGLTNLLVSGD